MNSQRSVWCACVCCWGCGFVKTLVDYTALCGTNTARACDRCCSSIIKNGNNLFCVFLNSLTWPPSPVTIVPGAPPFDFFNRAPTPRLLTVHSGQMTKKKNSDKVSPPSMAPLKKHTWGGLSQGGRSHLFPICVHRRTERCRWS